MAESAKNEVELPEDQCRAFDIFVMCGYSGMVEDAGKTTQETLSVLKAYQLADKLCMPDFQKILIEKLKQHSRKVLKHPRDLIWLLKNVLKESALYRFKWDQLVYDVRADKETYQSPKDGYNMGTALRDLLADTEISTQFLWACMGSKVLGESRAAREGCHYHIHGNGENCDVTKRKAKKAART
ncbi:hypothetical protein H2200_011882 [Cladophialophora chaetospira]|uniref:BTB domain-containing protein n=1 Tax=Cladophialophora chaetospira TaxID=386627 RepID=A0AA39CCY3_9EURO|nr:hypothetical protein H2200_011882 [Cladophialophora chaetospira]